MHPDNCSVAELPPVTCPLCYDALPNTRLRCGHAFCETCLAKWKSSHAAMAHTCPVCRASMDGPVNTPSTLFGTALSAVCGWFARGTSACVHQPAGRRFSVERERYRANLLAMYPDGPPQDRLARQDWEREFFG